jgi:hypothetical protein
MLRGIVEQEPSHETIPRIIEPRPIGAETANALVTEAPLTTAELTLLAAHYRALAALCEASGPRFSNARRDAVDMHNRAIRRLRGIRDEARRRALEHEDELLEIR